MAAALRSVRRHTWESLAQPLPRPLLCSSCYVLRNIHTSAARSRPHRTYFQPDSQSYRPLALPAQPLATPPVSNRSWTWLLVGFLAFPVAWSTAETLAARGLLPDQLTQKVFPMFQVAKALESVTQELENVKDAHLHESDMHRAMQRIFWEQLTSSAPEGSAHARKVVRDDSIIQRRPIHLDDGQAVAPKDACLLRVIDGDGRNQVVVLGVNLAAYRPRFRQEPDNICGLHRWIYQLVEDMHAQGGTAFNTEGETMYIVYTNNAIAMGPFYVGSGSANGSSHTEIIAVDPLQLPPGWPIQQLRRIPECESTDERVKAKDSGASQMTAEGLLATDILPHGPFH